MSVATYFQNVKEAAVNVGVVRYCSTFAVVFLGLAITPAIVADCSGLNDPPDPVRKTLQHTVTPPTSTVTASETITPTVTRTPGAPPAPEVTPTIKTTKTYTAPTPTVSETVTFTAPPVTVDPKK